MDDNDVQVTYTSLFVDPQVRKRNRKIFVAVCIAAVVLAVFIYVWVNFLHAIAFPSIIGRWELVDTSYWSEEEFEEMMERSGGIHELEFFENDTGVITTGIPPQVDFEIAYESFVAEMEQRGIEPHLYDWDLFSREFLRDTSEDAVIEIQRNYFTWVIRRGRLYLFMQGEDAYLYYQISRSELILEWELEYSDEYEYASMTFWRIE